MFSEPSLMEFSKWKKKKEEWSIFAPSAYESYPSGQLYKNESELGMWNSSLECRRENMYLIWKLLHQVVIMAQQIKSAAAIA